MGAFAVIVPMGSTNSASFFRRITSVSALGLVILALTCRNSCWLSASTSLSEKPCAVGAVAVL